MSQKMIDFLSSVGMMVFGIGLLFFCSITLTASPVQSLTAQLPTAHFQHFKAGGDLSLPALPISHPTVPLLNDKADFNGEISASSAVVVDDESNTVLFKKNPTEIRPLASITKLMTALVLNDLPINWNSSTIITEDDADPFSHHLEVGEKYTLAELWNVALIGSSNSAIHALVRMTGFTVDQFAEKMNAKARALGLGSLNFVEPTGLDSRNMGDAIDILRLFKEALKVSRISETLQTPEYYATPIGGKKKHQVWSTNWLLTGWIPNDFDKDVLVGKTGFIDESGYNFIVRLPGQKSHVVRAIVLGAATNEARFTEARDLGAWVLQNYLWPDDTGYSDLAGAH